LVSDPLFLAKQYYFRLGKLKEAVSLVNHHQQQQAVPQQSSSPSSNQTSSVQRTRTDKNAIGDPYKPLVSLLRMFLLLFNVYSL
jgi:hypothetical protein